jgi:hypothetical protein
LRDYTPREKLKEVILCNYEAGQLEQFIFKN